MPTNQKRKNPTVPEGPPVIHEGGIECAGETCRYCHLAFEARYSAKHLKGKILTLIDAVIPQGPQNKSAKDIAAQAIETEAEELMKSLQADLKAFDDGIVAKVPWFLIYD